MNVPSPSISLILLLPGVAVLVAAFVLIGRGRRGVRRGEAPHCRRCDYPLVGIDSDRCPECGADLRAPGAVARGERLRRPALIYGGAALAIVAALLLYSAASPIVRNFDWYTVMPTGSLIDRVDDRSPAVSNRAWAEMKRRMQSGDLAPRHRSRLADLALARQAAGTPGELIDWLGQAVLEGKLTDAQREKFFQQAAHVVLRVRPKVALGDAVPYEVSHQGRGPVASQGWWHRIEYMGVKLDGKQVDKGGGSSAGSGFGAGGSMGSWAPCDTPGRHTVSVDVKVRLFYGVPSFDEHDPRNKLMHERIVTLAAETEVLAESPVAAVKLLDDPSVAAMIQTFIRPEDFEWDPRGKGLSGSLKVGSPMPANLAFDVFVVSGGGAEHRLGSIALRRGTMTTFRLADQHLDLGGAAELDVVLRSSETVARRTVDLVEIWKGEVVFPKVPVKNGASHAEPK